MGYDPLFYILLIYMVLNFPLNTLHDFHLLFYLKQSTWNLCTLHTACSMQLFLRTSDRRQHNTASKSTKLSINNLLIDSPTQSKATLRTHTNAFCWESQTKEPQAFLSVEADNLENIVESI